VLVLCSSIVWQYWQHSLGQETKKVSPEDQVYMMPYHTRWVMHADAIYMQIHMDLKVSDL
jgi:hypothetical protein